MAIDFYWIITKLLGGIGVGSIYALLGLSFALIFGRLNICSVLHGDLAILAAYGIYWLFTLWNINPIITALLLISIFFMLGYLMQSTILKPFMSMEIWKGRYQGQVMVTQGTGMIIMALEFMFFTGTFRTLATDYRNKAIPLGTVNYQ